MLDKQRLTRPLTSVMYGKAANPDKSFGPMRDELRPLQRLVKRSEAPGNDVSAEALNVQLDRLEPLLKEYEQAHAGQLRRRIVNMPESIIRMGRAGAYGLSGWANGAVKNHYPDTKVPVVLLVQLLVTAVVWTLHWLWAGPKRDTLIRDEYLKVDIAARGPQMVRDLVERHTRQAAPAQLTEDMIPDLIDEQGIQALRGMVKDRKVAAMNAATALFKADQTPIFNELSKDLKLSLPQVKEYYTSVQPKEQQIATETEQSEPRAKLSAHEAGLSSLVRARVLGLGRQDQRRHAAHLEALQSIARDLDLLKHPARWIEIAPARKLVLNAALADPQRGVHLAQIFDYLFRGTSAKDPTVRTAHKVAKDMRSDNLRSGADKHYKFAKATQVALMGSSTFPFIANGVIGIIEASGQRVPVGVKIATTVIPLGIYFLGERYTGELVNLVMAKREQMVEQFPFGRPPGLSRRVVADMRQFAEEFFLVPMAVKNDITRGAVTSQAHKTIARARALPILQPGAVASQGA